jgi:glycine cleavage system aminomethyltransferase T/glycine/D-amino acid oxidase-like deaminating enzyme
MELPARSEIVIIGGGVVGCSIAYQLARRGKTDVTVLERRRLTEGSTWHAAGLVGQLRSSSNLTRLMRWSTATYETLERETGYPTGWRPVGSIRVAASDDRWTELRRLVTTASSFGFDVSLISPAQIRELFPLLRTDGIRGATWVPSDGYADPSQLTQSFAAGARAAGVRFIQHCRVMTMIINGSSVAAVGTELGQIECDVVVNATGMWGAETARLAGTDVAVGAVEHQYVVTERIGGLPADLPTFRDPDGRFYVKPEAGALAIGGWEDGTRAPWQAIPRDLGPELLPPDHERFEPLGEAAGHRIPVTADIGIKTWVNGPIPFSPDAEPLMGVTGYPRNLFHCCGFSAGIAAAGGAGHAMAAWIIDGDPGMDLWPFDVRRFGRPHSVPAYLEQRCIEAYAHYYQIGYPNRELSAPRGQRRSPLSDMLRARGAVPGTKFGWERANWFAPGAGETENLTFGRSNAWPHVGAEHRAVREAAGLIDLTSFAKYEITGPGAVGLLQKVAGADLDVRPGKIVYTQLLNERAGIEADVTVTRLAADEFYLVTGAGFGRHDASFIQLHGPDDGSAVIRDVTSAYGVLGLCGPLARDIARRLTRSDISNETFGYLTARRIDLGHAPVLALRVSYTGELGWEFHVPSEYLRDLYERLLAAGADAGLRDVGYRAVNSLRLEKQYLAWSADIRADDNPYAAGLGFAVRPDKPGLLAGAALRKIRDEGPAERLCWFSTGADVVMHGGELLALPGRDLAGRDLAGRDLAVSVRSAGYGYTVRRTIFSAYLPAALSGERDFVVEVAGQRYPATRNTEPLYDAAGTRIRG